MLKDLGIVTNRFYDYYDQEYFSKRNLGRGLYFSKQQYGSDVTAPDVMRGFGAEGGGNIEESVGRYPVAEASKAAFLRLLGEERDYLPDLSREEKIALLRRISYTDFLQQHAGMPKEVTGHPARWHPRILGRWLGFTVGARRIPSRHAGHAGARHR